VAPERLQKVLASAGIASRRDCEVLIAEGRIVVNGEVVQVAGTRVDPDVDEILVDGRPLGARQPRTYIVFHKPVGVVSTTEDPQGRPTVTSMVEVPQRLHLVGRLDFASEGLMLLTDDGAITQALTHPSHQVEKEYHALLNATPSADDLRDWRKGITLPALEDEGSDNDNYDGEMDTAGGATITTAPAWVTVMDQGDAGAWLRIVLHEGRKRQIRRVAKALGYDVLRLIRVREGPIELGDLPAGAWRQLSEEEVTKLQQHAEQAAAMARAIAQRQAAATRRATIHTEETAEPSKSDQLQKLQGEADRARRIMTGDDDDDAPAHRRDFIPHEDRHQHGRRDDTPRGGFRRGSDAPRRDFGDRPPRRDGDAPRRDFGDRPPRRDFGDRPPRRDFGDRPPRPEGNFRRDGDAPRRDFGDRPPRRDFGDRPPRRDFGDRPPRPEGNFRRDGDAPRRDFGDRPPRRDFGDRPPRRDFGDRPPRRDSGDRPPRDAPRRRNDDE
jgi:23S rRNA pseudouridine2605 synthase